MDNNQQMKNLDNDLTRRSEAAKSNWNKSGVYVWKSTNTAVLQKVTGRQVQFYLAFEDLTQQGFVLKAQDEGREGSSGGFSGGMNSFYFFQKTIGSENLKEVPKLTPKEAEKFAKNSYASEMKSKGKGSLPKGF
jgi:hypothetical protein